MPPKKSFSSIIGGKPHRSKKELQDRKDSEIKLGTTEIVMPINIKKNKVAVKKWKELMFLYKFQKIDIVTSADSDIIAQFCICHSELCYLITVQEKMKTSHKLNDTSVFDIIDEIGKIDNMINKKREAHSKLAAKLLLDPVSRVRAVPLEKPQKQTILQQSSFGGV